eukprot:TRINITY_DN3095_c0_g2_i2.p1 TRINITY_DN3095_c0_g2~~TRINITY_DN3095_c0_g2_i2.p1  ORF type:complete len:463 (-),score=79.90 TRINITY_DN3095_c0_g2_i2:139-1503(-)
MASAVDLLCGLFLLSLLQGGAMQSILMDQSSFSDTSGMVPGFYSQEPLALIIWADDFDVPAGEYWNITSIQTLGGYADATPLSAIYQHELFIYNNTSPTNNRPGDTFFSWVGTPSNGLTANSPNINFGGSGPKLSAGKYWLATFPDYNLVYDVNGPSSDGHIWLFRNATLGGTYGLPFMGIDYTGVLFTPTQTWFAAPDFGFPPAWRDFSFTITGVRYVASLTTGGLTTDGITTNLLQKLTTESPTTEAAVTTGVTTQSVTTKSLTTRPLTTQPLTTNKLTTSPLTTGQVSGPADITIRYDVDLADFDESAAIAGICAYLEITDCGTSNVITKRIWEGSTYHRFELVGALEDSWYSLYQSVSADSSELSDLVGYPILSISTDDPQPPTSGTTTDEGVDSEPREDSGLSPTLVILIPIICAVVALAIIVVAVVLVQRHRNNKEQKAETELKLTAD